jgi:hypothetical protein
MAPMGMGDVLGLRRQLSPAFRSERRLIYRHCVRRKD